MNNDNRKIHVQEYRHQELVKKAVCSSQKSTYYSLPDCMGSHKTVSFTDTAMITLKNTHKLNVMYNGRHPCATAEVEGVSAELLVTA
jgi:hypothetical protein